MSYRVAENSNLVTAGVSHPLSQSWKSSGVLQWYSNGREVLMWPLSKPLWTFETCICATSTKWVLGVLVHVASPNVHGDICRTILSGTLLVPHRADWERSQDFQYPVALYCLHSSGVSLCFWFCFFQLSIQFLQKLRSLEDKYSIEDYS